MVIPNLNAHSFFLLHSKIGALEVFRSPSSAREFLTRLSMNSVSFFYSIIRPQIPSIFRSSDLTRLRNRTADSSSVRTPLQRSFTQKRLYFLLSIFHFRTAPSLNEMATETIPTLILRSSLCPRRCNNQNYSHNMSTHIQQPQQPTGFYAPRAHFPVLLFPGHPIPRSSMSPF